MHRPDLKIVVAFVVGQSEIIQVVGDIVLAIFVVAEHGEEAIDGTAGAISALIVADVVVILLAHRSIQCLRRIDVVADGEGEVDIPAVNERRDRLFSIEASVTEIAEDRKAVQGLRSRLGRNVEGVVVRGCASVRRRCCYVKGDRGFGLGIESAST
ncbi:hypothetical protein D9M72_553460 [compost metagenome]